MKNNKLITIITLPVIIPGNPSYKEIIEEGNKLSRDLKNYLCDGYSIKLVTSATSRDVIYNTYVLEKEQ